jgi:hypothetical protein
VQVVAESFYFIFSHIFTFSSLDQDILLSILLPNTLCLPALSDNIKLTAKGSIKCKVGLINSSGKLLDDILQEILAVSFKAPLLCT